MSGRGAFVRGVAAAMLVAFLMIGWASPASAHDELAGSSPEAGSTVEVAPASVELRFGGAPLQLGATVIVADAAGRDHVVGPVSVSGEKVTAALDTLPADRNYQVRWRIVSGDGAVVAGHFDFGVGDTSTAEAIPEPRSDDSAAQRSPSGRDAGDFASVAASAGPDGRTSAATGSASEQSSRSTGRTLWYAVVGALAGLGALAAGRDIIGVLARRSTRQPSPQEGP